MVGLDVMMKVFLMCKLIEQLLIFGKIGEMFYVFFGYYNDCNQIGVVMYDVNMFFYLLYLEVFMIEKMWIDVQMEGFVNGEIVGDICGVYYDGKINVIVCVDIDVVVFNKWFLEIVVVID